jgi:pimeloyl-ACP methyl ester carboxylesterase
VGPPEILKGVAKGVRGSEYVVVKDAGHLPPMHRAEEVQQIVLDFLAGDGNLRQNPIDLY